MSRVSRSASRSRSRSRSPASGDDNKRASSSPKRSSEEPKKKLYVGNLSWEMRDDDLYEAFEKYGKVESASVSMERESGRSRGFGFVTMETEDEANKAVKGLNGEELKGRRVRIEFANEGRGGRGGGRGGFRGGGGRYRGGEGRRDYGGRRGGGGRRYDRDDRRDRRDRGDRDRKRYDDYDDRRY